MKTNKTTLLFFAAMMLLLTACSRAPIDPLVSDSVNQVNEASKKFADLKNGQFTYTITTKGEGESLEGIFLNRENDVDWFIRSTVIEDQKKSTLATEYVKKENRYYRRFLMDVKENSFLAGNLELQAGTWHEIPENNPAIPDYASLFHVENVEEDNIESAEKTERAGLTRYHFIFSQRYLRSLKQLNLWVLRIQFLVAKIEDSEGYEALMLEYKVKDMKSKEYRELEETWSVNEEGMFQHLLRRSSTDQVTEDGIEVIPQEITIELLEYNQPEMEAAFPVMDPGM